MHLSIFAMFEWISWFATPANWPIVLAVAGGLGFVIFVHELGHFLVAKACGVKCEKFYLGFDVYGLKLFKFQWGETEYGIGILPLGGYVKMLGQDDNPARMAEETQRAKAQADQATAATAGTASGKSLAAAEHAPALTHGDLPSEPVSDPHVPYDPRSYMAQSVPKRMAIISAGVIMNVIFAFLMASLAYGLGVKETPCVVGAVTAGGAAWKANLQPGDEIIRIGSLKNPRYRDLRTRVPLSDAVAGIEFEVKRAGVEKPFVVTLHPENSLGIPLIGVQPDMQTRLDEKYPTDTDSSAANAKPALEGGDKIVKIGDREINAYTDILKQLSIQVDQTLHVTASRVSPEEKKSITESAAENLKPEEIEQKLDAVAKSFELDVAATPVRDLGMIMTMGPIVAVQKDSPAEKAGIKPNDVLLAVNGEPIGNPMTLPNRIAAIAKRGESVVLKIEREDTRDMPETLEITIKPQVLDWYYPAGLPVDPLIVASLGLGYSVEAKVVSVVPGSPAAEAQIVPGDVVTKVQFLVPKDQPKDDKGDKEKPVKKDSEIVEIDEETPAWAYLVLREFTFSDPTAKVKLWIEHDGKERNVELTPVVAKLEDGSDWNIPDRGFNFDPITFTQIAKSPLEAFKLGSQETVDNLLMVYRFLQRIGQKRISLKMMSGPVGIAQVAGMKVQEGFSSFLLFLTMLSANLAVVNFLPIPVLDGGHMVFLAYEGIRGKPASERVIIAFTYAGLIFLLSMMLFVLSLDLGWISRR